MSLDLQIVHEALPAYDIGKEIGRGGGGVVLSATHRHLGRRVAIKQLPRAFSSDEAVRDRFYEEARLAASLDHPHIVPVYDYVEHGGVCLIVMELMTHGSLWARHHREGLMPDEACGVVLAVLSALEYAHSKLCVHRDVKPDNVLFGPGGVVKLSDFGIAKVLGGGGGRTMSGEVVGTPAYMAPEQASGEAVGPGTDVYATGVVLYELLAGRLPFPATSSPVQQLYQHVHEQPAPLLEVAPSVSPVVAEVVMRSIAKDPAERYGRAETFGVALARAAAEAFGPRWVHHCGVELLTSAEIAEAAVWQPTGAQPRVAPPAPDQASTGAPSGAPAAPPEAGAPPPGAPAPAAGSPAGPGAAVGEAPGAARGFTGGAGPVRPTTGAPGAADLAELPPGHPSRAAAGITEVRATSSALRWLPIAALALVAAAILYVFVLRDPGEPKSAPTQPAPGAVTTVATTAPAPPTSAGG